MLASAAVAAGAPPVSTDAVSRLSQERIIGSSDLLDINYLELAIAVSRGVARIQIGNAYGTGFLVGPGLLMTNHHVIENEDDARRSTAQFDYQDNAGGELLPRQDYRIDPATFFVTSGDLDFTIVGVESVSNRNRRLNVYPWLKLIGDLGKAEKGDFLNIIQHPRGGLKQIAFRRNEIIEIPDGLPDFLYYTTDTEPGSSGSPCFNDQWELVALHHSGVPERNAQKEILRIDGQVWRKGIDPDGLIHWVGNEGARVFAIVTALRATSMKPEWRDRRDQMLESSPPNPIELAREDAAGGQPSGGDTTTGRPDTNGSGTRDLQKGANMGQSFTWTIPVQLTVTVGGAAPITQAPGAPPVEAKPEEAVTEVTIDPNWSKRKGYDPNFLVTPIPLPGLSDAMKQNTVEVPPQYRHNNQKYILNYYHYSVAMNKKRRCAWFSAGMIDGTRFKDFKRGKDKWFLDTRIDRKFQMGEELYAAASTDRGHLTRFKDVSWGATMDEAVKSTNDTFHFTNAALQLAGFNEGKSRWQGLELFLLEQHAEAEQRKMIVLTGPVLLDSDPLYKNDFMDYSTRIPLAFWKVCCLRRKDGSLAATGFKLGQEDITSLPGFEEKFDVIAAQVTIHELETLTGLNFGVLTQHDHFAEGGDPGTLEILKPDGGVRRIKPIQDFSDIVV
jgi:endonuclease G